MPRRPTRKLSSYRSPRRVRRSAVTRAVVLAALAGTPATSVSAGDWHRLPVPDSWKRPPRGELAPRDGFAWYRCEVVVPASWRGRNLELFIEPVDDARQVYFNGMLIGAAGTFPPRYRSGLGEPGRHRVPPRLPRHGERNVVAVRTYYSDGRTNFSVAAPVLLAGDEAIRMEGSWQYRPGDDPAWATGELEDGEASLFSAVDRVKDVDRYVRERQGDRDPLDPAPALASFRVAPDLAIDQPLSEPAVRQPLFIDFDERGRLWVVQYLQYPDPAGLKMVSRDKHLRTVYDRVPPPPPRHFPGRDRITIHEDTDGDGIYDHHRTFVEGLNIATSLARGRGGVWVLNPPYLLFYPDRDGDDRPDGDPEVHLEGFGLQDTHSVVNSLRWGPDGWLYATQGSTVTASVRRPGEAETVDSMGQLVFRYHPETRRYEIFAEGGGNAFGLEIDASGRIYSGTNGGDARGFHYVQGGYYRKNFGKHGALSNPHAFGYFEDMEHNKVPRFTHNFIIYAGDGLPGQYRGRLFGIEPLQGQIVQSEVLRDRSSFRTRDIDRPVTTDDPWFRPVDIKLGPDGAIYIADFYEQRIDHSSHYAGRIDRSSGRIYRIRSRDASPSRPPDLSGLSSDKLLDLLGHPNKWHRQVALRLLGDRQDRSILPLLVERVEQGTGQRALECLWALHLIGGLDEALALKTLDHPTPHVRLWTARLLCDRREVTRPVAAKLALRAASEPDVEVRSQLASSARRLPARDALPIVRGLLEHGEDAYDIHVPLLLWWAIESKLDSDREAVLALLADAAIWRLALVKDHLLERLMRRFAVSGRREDLLVCARLLDLAPSRKEGAILLRGLEAAFQGRSLAGMPAELTEALESAGGGSPTLRLRRGDAQELDRALVTVRDAAAEESRRLEIIQILGEIRRAECVPALLEVTRTARAQTVRRAALTALQNFDDERIGREVLDLHERLSPDVREVAHTLLATRSRWTLLLLRACDSGKIDPASLPLAAVRKMLLHDDQRIAALIRKHWGEVEGRTTGEMRARIAELAELIAAGSGNPYDGKKLYARNCGKCHVLFGEGGSIGPDLTPFQRDDLDRLLLNIVNPGAEIREGFENYLVITRDGRVVNGFVADEDSQVVVLRGADGQNLVIPRDTIVTKRAIATSVMPEGALDGLTDQEIRDLFAYLRSAQPVP